MTTKRLVLPEKILPAKLVLNPGRPLSEDEYFMFCMANPDLQIERTAQGDIVVAPPASGESDYRSGEIFGQLRDWAKRDRRGKAFTASVGFLLPDGSALSPDTAWASNETIARLTKQERNKFLALVPEFIAEVVSPSDRLAAQKRKLEQWIANGVQLGWLIHAEHETVYVYRPGQPVDKKTGLHELAAGEGPLNGFVLQLADIWTGL